MTEQLGYVGDGVYLSFDGYHYLLAVNHHENVVVALEPDVLLQMNSMIQKHKKGGNDDNAS